MKTKGRADPAAVIAKARASWSSEVLASHKHPSAFARGKTLAHYVEAKLGPESKLSLRAKLAVVFEVSRIVDGGTVGELREVERAREAARALSPGSSVFSRATPGRSGVVVSVDLERLLARVRWADGEESDAPVLALAPNTF